MHKLWTKWHPSLRLVNELSIYPNWTVIGLEGTYPWESLSSKGDMLNDDSIR